MSDIAFLKQIDTDAVTQAIAQAERGTRAEMRIFISRNKVSDPMPAAKRAFEKLGMTGTKDRNGVLIFIAPAGRTMAVLGDSGIHQRVGEDHWRQVVEQVLACFRQGQFTEGLVGAVATLGRTLAEHFPHESDDRNELSDDVAHD